MKNKEIPVLEDYCLESGIYGIPAAAEEFDVNKFRYLRITDISDDGVLLSDDVKSISNEDAAKYLLTEDDIVFARTGNSTGRTYFYDKRDGKLVFAGFLIKYKLDPNKINPKYLKYFTISKQYKHWVDNFSTGSTRGNMSAQDFGGMPLIVPDRKQQNLLVKILDSITYKISLNNRINSELEQMAKTLYNYWFVQFDFPNEKGEPYKSSGGKMEYNNELKREIPKEWEVGKLVEVANITMGQSPSGKSYNEVGEGMVFYQGSTDFNFRYPLVRMYTTEPSRIANEEDILLSVRAPVGTINIANEKCCIGRGLASLNSKFEANSFLLYLMFYFKSMLDVQNRTGTTFGSIDKDTLYDLKFAKPPV
ncbi:MAG TPA: restriction endonuclease subunit S, partial [Ignavibacteria bacterium]